MPYKYRKVSRDGIHHRNRIYDSELLADLRGRKSNEGDGRWRVHYDPTNTNAVWIRHPVSGEWIEALDRALAISRAPMVSEVSRQLAGAHPRTKVPATGPQRDWHQELDAREAQLGRSTKRRKTAAGGADKADGWNQPDQPPARPVKLAHKRKPTVPVDVSGIDWDSPVFDIARPRAI